MKINSANAEHYSWGNSCDGWHLLKTDSLSIIQERMPSNTFENRHYHHYSQQFFFILSGEATFEIEGIIHVLQAGEGIYIAPLKKHKVSNEALADLHFLVISQPKSHGDKSFCE